MQSSVESNSSAEYREKMGRQINTQLAMIIDPAVQSAESACNRVKTFVEQGGNTIFIGGSGVIPNGEFQGTIYAVSQILIPRNTSLWILPGDTSQIPDTNIGVTGLLNYRCILGSEGQSFDKVYPPESRKEVEAILDERCIPDIPTLYALCGDPSASVSRVTGISPFDFSKPEQESTFLQKTDEFMESDIACIFLESGSKSNFHLNPEIAIKIRQLIDAKNKELTLIVSGGIKNPEQAKLFKGVADIVIVGGHFEENSAIDTQLFVEALKV